MRQEELQNRIMYEDRQILVVHKPAGIAVQHASVGQFDLESGLLTHLTRDNAEDRIPYLGVVHRLDQPVEGILVFAKSRQAAADLNRQQKNGKMEKRYLAVVEGICRKRESVLCDYLRKDARNRRAEVVPEGMPGAKKARLRYRLLEQRETDALVEITLFTGRYHQIRVQMMHAGLPLLGDRKYNPLTKGTHLMLCACELTFCHPSTGEKLQFRLPDDGMRFMKEYQSVAEREGEHSC